MAEPKQFDLLKKDVAGWNAWRMENANEKIELFGADLSEVNLRNADLCHAYLHSANLSEANLHGVNLRGANLGEVRDLEQSQIDQCAPGPEPRDLPSYLL